MTDLVDCSNALRYFSHDAENFYAERRCETPLLIFFSMFTVLFVHIFLGDNYFNANIFDLVRSTYLSAYQQIQYIVLETAKFRKPHRAKQPARDDVVAGL